MMRPGVHSVCAAADVDDEAAQDLDALLRVRHFGMELHAVAPLGFVRDRGNRHAVGRADDGVARRHRGDAVAVRHPDVELAGRAGEAIEQLVRRDRLHRRVAKLARMPAFDRAAELHRHRLHAVADAEQRQAGFERLLRRARRGLFGRRFGPARQDDSARRELRDLGRIVVPGPDLAIDADLADAPRDQLCVLRTEIEDQDLVGVDVHVVFHRGSFFIGLRLWRRRAALRAARGATWQTD